MSVADCNKCLRRHVRPAGKNCEYFKHAVQHCTELGIPETDYMLNLPDIGELSVDQSEVGAGVCYVKF